MLAPLSSGENNPIGREIVTHYLTFSLQQSLPRATPAPIVVLIDKWKSPIAIALGENR